MRVVKLGLAAAAVLVSGQAAQAATTEAIAAAAAKIQPKVVTWRRDFHQHPELGEQETRTAGIVAKHLKDLGFEVRTGVAKTGVVGVLKGGKPGGVVALRADMDGLPVEEKTGLPFASKAKAMWEGKEMPVMHACGHDTHVAMLMGAAEILAGMKDQIQGTVVLIFQPAEEGMQAGAGIGGAELMVKEGVLTSPKVDAVFGIHIGPGEPGVLNWRSGGFYASVDRITIKLKGRQTHGARPWSGVDLSSTASEIVTALNGVAARQLDVAASPTIITIATMHGGVRNNIIPEDFVMEGTLRTFSDERNKDVKARIEKTVNNIAAAWGATAEVGFSGYYPVTYNDPALTKWAEPSLVRATGGKIEANGDLVTGAEDFSFFAQKVPGLYLQLGGRKAQYKAGESPVNHSPYFDIDERVLETGVKAHVTLAMDYLDSKATK